MNDGQTDVFGTYNFVTTAKASADAHALVGQRLGRLDIVIDSAAVLLGLLMTILGQPLGLVRRQCHEPRARLVAQSPRRSRGPLRRRQPRKPGMVLTLTDLILTSPGYSADNRVGGFA